MVNLLIKSNQLRIEDASQAIFDWKGRLFFNLSLGFEVDEDNNRYFFSEKNEFQDIVKEVISYLKDEDIDFTTDDRVSILVDKIGGQASDFLEAGANLLKPIILDISPRLERTLKPYQEIGLKHLIRIKHGANFSVPGSGKTTVIYAYYDWLREHEGIEKIFVIGPFSSFSPWEEESEKCFGKRLQSTRLVGSKRNLTYLHSDQFELFLCHYQTAANDKNKIIELCDRHKVLLVIDESHYIKRFAGGVWSDAVIAIAPHATRRVILTGTPMPNGYRDLWSQMTFLWPGKQLLGERNAYKTRIDDVSQHDEIKRAIRPYFCRVKKSDLHLPKPQFLKKEYDLKPYQAQIYNALSVRLLSGLDLQPDDRIKLRQWRKAKMVRLIQAASNPTLLGKYSEEFAIPPLDPDGTPLVEVIEKYSQYGEIPAKFQAAIELALRLLSENKKVILWTTFVHNIKMLEKLLGSVNYYTIHGAIPKDDNEDEVFNREKQIRDFKSTNEPSVLIANPAACAESISLHKICHDAIYLDRSFNCGQFIQSLDRIHRIGLDKNEKVTYHILIAKNTIDETIDQRLDEKQATMLRVLEDELPVGDLDVESYEMEETDSEEELDFNATMKDLRKFSKSVDKT